MRADGRDSAKRAAASKAWRQKNPNKVHVTKGVWEGANRDKVSTHNRRRYLKKTYGITIEEHDAILLSQGGRCKICRTDKAKRTGHWCVDHDHKTGAVRGILCHDCNLAIGHVKDSPIILEAMIVYLQRES